MGGGGGGGSYTLGDTRALEEAAKEELRQGAGERKNVFLSFVVEDVSEVNLLRGQAKNENSEIEFNDWSVREPYDSDRASYIKQKIGERISQCSVTVVYLSDKTASSRWVAWEIEESLKRGKRVIGVHKGSTAPATLPSAIKQHGIKVVPWSKLASEL